jgi:hypothetical protein
MDPERSTDTQPLATATRGAQDFGPADRGPTEKERSMNDKEQIEKDKKQLAELQEEIDQVRREADPPDKHEPTFADSGTVGEEYDDQTIAPPG